MANATHIRVIKEKKTKFKLVSYLLGKSCSLLKKKINEKNFNFKIPLYKYHGGNRSVLFLFLLKMVFLFVIV